MIAMPYCGSRRPTCASSWAMSAKPMGSIIAAVAGFEIHSEMKAGAARDPARSRRGHPRGDPRRRGAEPVHDPERDAPVQVPLLHRRGDRHAAGEEEDVRID